MTIHFVYATPGPFGRKHRLLTRAVMEAQRAGLPVPFFPSRSNVDVSRWPERAPISITKHVLPFLAEMGPVQLYDWRERLLIRGERNDVLMGHPFPDDSTRVFNRSMSHGGFGACVAMTPLSHQMPEVCGRIDSLVPNLHAIFGIMGRYWWDTWKSSALAHWYDKIVPLDMAIDIHSFPRVKRRFNPPGKRRFLYLGWRGAQKGTHLLSILFGLAGGNLCVAVGWGPSVPNIDCRPDSRLDASRLAELASECDFLITMGVSDANPTTILEAMAWGFPVLCTPQSGYYAMPEVFELSITDMKHNLRILDRLQFASEAELVAHADRARALVQREYTWPRFNHRLGQALSGVAAMNGIELKHSPGKEA